MFTAPDAALIRVAACPTGLLLPTWPDLTSSEQPEPWRWWLTEAWELPGFAAAVTVAAPHLAEHVERMLAGQATPPRRLRRLVESTVRYLLRWTTRATPFGWFAGVAPVTFGPRAVVRWGEHHHAEVRPSGEFIAEYTAQAERDLVTLRTVAVVTNQVGYRRGDRWVLPCARINDGHRWDVEIRLSGPVRAALQAAASPIGFTDLAAGIGGQTLLSRRAAERMLADLVGQGALLSALRPAMTVTDPARHLAHHNIALPDPGGRVAVDLRVDAAVTLPPSVVREATQAASTLVAVAPSFPEWTEYHSAFLGRWGPGAAVPVRQVLDVLGFPAGYRRSARRVPAVFTARDRLLVELAQRSLLDGQGEVTLDDDLITRLRGDDQRPPVPHTELRFTLAAETPRDLDRGAFTLTVISGSRHAGVTAARFLHLLNPGELASFQRVYQNLPTALAGAQVVQVSGPPLDARLTAVARAPELLPVLPVGDFHPDSSWDLADVAVTGDGQRLWLVSLTTGAPVEPLLLNCVLPALQQPLARFLNEIWTMGTAPCTRFDWGHAAGLPYLPRIRSGRAILYPARWIIDRSVFPARSAPWSQWSDAWQCHREHHRIPREVLVGGDDVRIRLDLDDLTQLAILRGHLDRQPRTTICEAPGPAGWIDGRPAELLLTLTRTAPAPRPPRVARPVSQVQHHPGDSPWLEVRLYGRTDDILTDIVGRPEDHLPMGWWFLRYPDPEPHLRLRIPVQGTDDFATITRHLAQWARHLETEGALCDYALHVYRPETRHGTGETLAAAEAVFAADSHAALHRLGGDRQSTTAASMITIADGFTGDGHRWLADHVPHHSGPRLDPTQLDLARIPWYDQSLAAALADYRRLAEPDGLDLDQVLGDLLHLHHARMIGVDPASERHCLRLARTIARTRFRTTP